MSLLCSLSPNLARTLKKKLISASFKMFRTQKLKSKSPTDSRDFCPDPPSNEKLNSSLFWMNQTILIIFVFFMKITFFFSEKSYGNRLDPPAPSMENSITFNVFFIETFPQVICFYKSYNCEFIVLFTPPPLVVVVSSYLIVNSMYFHYIPCTFFQKCRSSVCLLEWVIWDREREPWWMAKWKKKGGATRKQ